MNSNETANLQIELNMQKYTFFVIYSNLQTCFMDLCSKYYTTYKLKASIFILLKLKIFGKNVKIWFWFYEPNITLAELKENILYFLLFKF